MVRQNPINATEVARRDLEQHFDNVTVTDSGDDRVAGVITRCVRSERVDPTGMAMVDAAKAEGFDINGVFAREESDGFDMIIVAVGRDK